MALPPLPFEELHKKKGRRISMYIHIAILLLALIPFFKADPDKNIDTQYAVQIAFDRKDIVFNNSKSSASSKSSSTEGAKRPKEEVSKPAPKPTPTPRPEVKPVEVPKVSQPKPTVEETKPTPKPSPVVKKPTPTPQPSEPVEAEIVTEESEVVAVEEEIPTETQEPEVYEAPVPVDIPTEVPEPSKSSLPSLEDLLAKIEDEVGDILDGIPTENAEPTEEESGGGGLPSDSSDDSDAGSGTGDTGEGKGDGKEGNDNDDGIGDGGVGDGEYDDSGDGVFGRRVVHRDYSMIQKATGKSGKIVFKVCIGRNGLVTYTEIDEFQTTITDRQILRDAVKSIQKYKYEPDPTAPKEQCGKFTLKIDNFQGVR